jgi:hypothetical protein
MAMLLYQHVINLLGDKTFLGLVIEQVAHHIEMRMQEVQYGSGFCFDHAVGVLVRSGISRIHPLGLRTFFDERVFESHLFYGGHISRADLRKCCLLVFWKEHIFYHCFFVRIG